MYNTHQKRRERTAVIDWVANDNYTHAITLNTDRELSLANLKKVFSKFCLMFDRSVRPTRNIASFPIDLRLRAIVFPEHLATNAHLHGFVDFAPAIEARGSQWCLDDKVRIAWLRATGGAGSVDLQPKPDSGWAGYCTKRYDGNYILAADFHAR